LVWGGRGVEQGVGSTGGCWKHGRVARPCSVLLRLLRATRAVSAAAGSDEAPDRCARLRSLVNGRQPPLHVPQADQAQAGGGCRLAVVLVLEDPVDWGGRAGIGGLR